MRIFISYSHKDKFAASMIELWLAEAGLIPLRDESTFVPGKTIPDSIREQIGQCDVFLVVLSANFYERTDWTTDELGCAAGLGKPILFVAIENVLPQGPYQLATPLELWRQDAARRRNSVVEAVTRMLGEHTAPDRDHLDGWCSRHFGCNRSVEERVAYENLAYSRLHVASTVELAAKWNGWTPGDLVARDAGTWEPEDDVVAVFNQLKLRDHFPEPDNYGLRSFREDLSDEPWLALDLRRVSHDLVRVVADHFEKIASHERPRRHLFEAGSIPYPNSVVVHLAVVTADNYLLIGHRSSRPRFYENCWSITYEEHMRASLDGPDPFATALRGLKEELIGHERAAVRRDAVRLFSLFRELDYWTNEERRESFWDINIGVGGVVRVPLRAQEVFETWLKMAEDKREFRHLLAVPYTFPNVLRLARADALDPAELLDAVYPSGLRRDFPDFIGKPKWRRQHPTNRIRLIRCLTGDFLRPLSRESGVV